VIFTSTITVPLNTPAVSPLVTHLKVLKGFIYKFFIMFPPGPSGLVHAWVMEGNLQVYPSNEGETFYGDNIAMPYEDLYEITNDNRQLDIYCYNLDTAYDHTIQLQFGIESKDIYMARWIPSMQVELFNAEMERIAKEKSATRMEKVDSVITRFGKKGIDRHGNGT
jgi:hypothetical protein